jgi:hypothetical protein
MAENLHSRNYRIEGIFSINVETLYSMPEIQEGIRQDLLIEKLSIALSLDGTITSTDDFPAFQHKLLTDAKPQMTVDWSVVN